MPLSSFLLIFGFGLLLPGRACAEAAAPWRWPSHLLSDAKAGLEPQGLLLLSLAGAGEQAARASDHAGKESVLQSARLGQAFAADVSMAGGTAVLLPGTMLSYAAGLVSGSEDARLFGEMGVESLALSGLTSIALKSTVRRRRPDGADLRSFPSGHSSAAFAVAAVAASQFGWAAGVPAFVGAGLIGYSRLELNKHYLSDVLFGAGLGIACGRAVAGAHLGRGSLLSLQVEPGAVRLALRF